MAPAAGRAASWTVSATLCVPPGGSREIDVLVSGATYDGSYWDWPGGSSYARRTVRAGRAALFYDRPGTGDSSRPPGVEVTVGSDAHVVHQLVQWARHRRFREVNLVGHSLGTMIVTVAAARYKGVDRVVLTGLLHRVSAGMNRLLVSFVPVEGRPGYVTTRPGSRRAAFYSGSADPAVIARDERTKDVVSLVEVFDMGTRLLLPPVLADSAGITAPVLIVLGEQDTTCDNGFDCAAPGIVLAHERPYFGSAASLSAVTIPGTGHDLTLHPSAGRSFKVIDGWIRHG